MKRIILTIIVCGLVATSATAQSVIPFSVYGGLGISKPSGPSDFKDAFKTGYHGSVGLGFPFLVSMQALIKVEYHKFGWNEPEAILVTDADLGLWMFGAQARLIPGVPMAPMRPYALAGVGVGIFTFEEPTGLADAKEAFDAAYEDQSKVYVELGGGLEFGGGPLKFFLQGKWVNIKTGGANRTMIPISVGVRFF